MENNDEILEEIEEIKEDKTTIAADNQIDNMLDQAMDNTSILTSPSTNNSVATSEPINPENNNVSEPVENNNGIVDNTITSDDLNYSEPKKGKTAIIIILSVLLILDIIALVLYLVGLDKLGFIK